MKLVQLAPAVATAMLLASPALAANMLSNGDFEAGGGSLAGWNVSPAVSVAPYSYFGIFGAEASPEQSGNYTAWFTDNAQMTQTFEADPNLYYVLTFDYAVIGEGQKKTLNVFVVSEYPTRDVATFIYPEHFPDNDLSTSFRTYHKRFAGLTGAVTIVFDSAGAPGTRRQLIDNVSVAAYDYPIGIGVPEPTTWALTIAGFYGAGGMLRRRHAQRTPGHAGAGAPRYRNCGCG